MFINQILIYLTAMHITFKIVLFFKLVFSCRVDFFFFFASQKKPQNFNLFYKDDSKLINEQIFANISIIFH